MVEKRFKHDQFFAAGLIGSVEGVCLLDRFTGFVVLGFVDWDRCVFCVDGCEAGEPVEPTSAEAAEIQRAIGEALGLVNDAQFTDCVILRQDSIPAL
jgi:hypothetical protein